MDINSWPAKRQLEGEHDDAGAIKPWIWVLLIALGPIISTLLEARYLVLTVSKPSPSCSLCFWRLFKTRTVVHVETVCTQLVFEHALRIRLYAPSIGAEKVHSTESPISLASDTQAKQSQREGVAGPRPDVAAYNHSTGDSKALKGSERTNLPSPSKSHVSNPQKSLIGLMTNLITTDLAILKNPIVSLLEIRELTFIAFPLRWSIQLCLHSSVRCSNDYSFGGLSLQNTRLEVNSDSHSVRASLKICGTALCSVLWLCWSPCLYHR